MSVRRPNKESVLAQIASLNPVKDDERTTISKKVSWILRRGAKVAGVIMDEDGWVQISRLCKAEVLNGISEEELMQVIVDFNGQKLRYELKETRTGGKLIRAYTKAARKAREKMGGNGAVVTESQELKFSKEVKESNTAEEALYEDPMMYGSVNAYGGGNYAEYYAYMAQWQQYQAMQNMQNMQMQRQQEIEYGRQLEAVAEVEACERELAIRARERREREDYFEEMERMRPAMPRPGGTCYGQVKKIGDNFGFIWCPAIYEHTGRDVFFNQNETGNATLAVHDHVSFVFETPHRPKATQIEICAEKTSTSRWIQRKSGRKVSKIGLEAAEGADEEEQGTEVTQRN